MIPVLFKEDEQVFSHNGIGSLYEALSCDVVEIENGAFTMELEYPVDGELFSELKDFRIIQAKPNDIDDPHNFRIYEIVKSIDELTVYVRANTITNDLGSNLISRYAGLNETPQQVMNGIKNNLIEPTNFDLVTDLETKSNVEWVRLNPLNAIVGVRGSMVDIWGGQIKRTNTAIYLYSRRGKDKVATVRPGKNLEGFDMTVSTAGIVTKVLPTFSYRPVDIPKYQIVTMSDGTREKRRIANTGDVNISDDVTVIGNVVTSKYVDNYPVNHWRSVDYGDDEELKESVDDFINTRLEEAEESASIIDNSGFKDELKDFVKQELDKKAKQYFTHRNPGVDQPTVRIKVDMLQLSDSPDWELFENLERIGITDTVEVWVEEYDIDVVVRVTELQYDSLGERVKRFEAGSDRPPRQTNIEKQYADLSKELNDYKTTIENGVRNIMRNTADGLNRKFEGYTEPPAELSSEGDIWFKEVGSGKVEIWIHDGVYWQPLMTDVFAEQIQAEVDEATESANKAVDSINEAVESAGFTSLEEAILDIQTIGNNAQNNADDAISNALAALDDARTALDNSQTAMELSDDAIDSANSALNLANDAIGDASSAVTAADNAVTQSSNALDEAALATTAANEAKDSANSAQTQASNLSQQVSDFDITIDGFNQTINDYEGQVASLTNDISGFESTVVNYELQLDEYGNTVDTYATEVSTMRNTVSGFESTVATYGQEVNSLTGEVNTYTTQVSEFENTVNGLSNTVASYEAELDEFGNVVGTYTTQVSQFENTVNGLNSTVVGYETAVLGYEDEVTLYKNQVSTLNNTVDGFDSTVANYTTQLDEFGNTVDAYTTEVSTMRNTVSGFESTVATYGQEVSSLTGEVSTYANQVSNFSNTVNGLNNTVASYETELDEFGNIVDTYASQVSNFSNTVSGLNSTVATYGAEVSNLAGEVVGYKNQVSTLNNTVSGFNSTVTQVQYDLDNLEIGGRNLLIESELIRDRYISASTTYQGEPSSAGFFITPPKPIDKAKYFTASITVGGTAQNLRMLFLDSNLENISYEGRASLLSHTWEVPSNAEYYVFCTHDSDGNKYKLEKGNKATDWTPAPEDMATVSQVSTLTNTVNGLNSTVAEYKTELIGYRGDVTQYKNQVSTMTNTVNGFNNTVAQYTTEVDEFGNEVDAYATEVSTLTNTVSGFQSKVTKVEQDYAGISGTVANHTTSISNINGQIALKANTTTVNTLTGRVTTAETAITANANAIKLKASTSQVNTLSGQVTTLDGQISVMAGEITSKVGMSEVEGLIDELDPISNMYSGRWVSSGANLSVSYPNDILRVVQSVNFSAVSGNDNRIWDPGIFIAQGTSVNISGEVRMTSGSSGSMTFAQTHSGTNRGFQVSTTSTWRSFGGNYTALTNGSFSLFFHNIGTYEIRNLQMTLGGGASPLQINNIESEITQKHNAITSTVSSIDGRVATNKLTIDGAITRVGNAEGKITTIETNVSGLQTTVAGKAAQSQVTQLENGLNALVQAKPLGLLPEHRNLSTQGTWSGWTIETGVTFQRIVNNRTEVYVERAGARIYYAGLNLEKGKKYKITFNASTHVAGREISLGRGSANMDRIPLTTTGNTYEVIFESDATSNFSIYFHTGGTFEIGNVSVVETTAIGKGQISVLSDNINLRVSKGDVTSQINIEAGKTLISSKKLVISATNTTIAGTSWMDAAVIKDATIDSAKIHSLDVSKISGNKAEFITASFNGINGSIQIDGDGIYMAGSGVWRRTYLSSTGFTLYNAGTNKSGAMGYFKEHLSSTTSGEDYFADVKDTKHYIGIGVNDTHHMAFGYQSDPSINRRYAKALQIDGDTGLVRLYSNIAAGNSSYGIRLRAYDGDGLYGTAWERNDAGILFGINGTYIWDYGGNTWDRYNMTNRQKIGFYGDGGIQTLTTNKNMDIWTGGSTIDFWTSINQRKFRIGDGAIQVYANMGMNGYTITGQSDERLKTNIRAREELIINKLKHFNFVDFDWIESGRSAFGVIAQQVQKFAPELVDTDETNMLTINNTLLNFYTTKSVVEVNQKVDDLRESTDDKIHKLQQELSKANRRIEELEGAI